MALVLKQNKTFNPNISNQYGVDLTNNSYYAVIDSIDYSKKENVCYWIVEIYANQQARLNNVAPVEVIVFNFSGDNFDVIGRDGYTITDAYIKSMENDRLIDFESDEE